MLPEFKLTAHVHITSGRKIEPLYGLAFDRFQWLISKRHRFAVCGGSRIVALDASTMEILESWCDQSEHESYYTCDWSYYAKTSVLAVAGKLGYIRLFYPDSHQNDLPQLLQGHGQAVNEMHFHPVQWHFLLSASKDFTIRLWDSRAGQCLAVYGGESGHRDEVLSCRWGAGGGWFVSSGMDHGCKVWWAGGSEEDENTDSCPRKLLFNSFSADQGVGERMKLHSLHWAAVDNGTAKNASLPYREVNVKSVHYPVFSSTRVHRHYVDCVRWFGCPNANGGALLASKSISGCISLWQGCISDWSSVQTIRDGKTVQVASMALPESDIWFVKFDIAPCGTWLAAGNGTGQVRLFDLVNFDEQEENALLFHAEAQQILSHPLCKSVIRQVAISTCGTFLLTVSDEGCVWRWESRNESGDN